MRTKPKSATPALQYRQGDVLLVRVPLIPGTTTRAPREDGRVILAHGEVTGHAHAISERGVDLLIQDDPAEMAAAARDLLASVGLTVEIRDEDVVGYLNVGEDAAVRHEEHAEIPLAAGDQFLVLRQREYSPEAIRQVID